MTIEIKQHRHKTAYSWALIHKGMPIITGLTLEQAIQEKEKREKNGTSQERKKG